ncbi:MAG: tetratricopeptide repeat protein [Ignavibacteria bacterium]|nr:tetratricopeptide repeat protein [Ignavibacteria bacterium]
MSRFITITLVVGHFLGPASGWSRQSVSGPMETQLMRAIDHTLRQEYWAAESVFRLLAEEYPNHPAANLYWAGMLQARAEDYSELPDRRRFDSLLIVADEKAQRLQSREETLAEGLYYAGSVLSYQSYVSSSTGEWFRAVTKGISAVSNLNKALARDSSLVGCYVGIGTYNYWKSRKTQFLSWLPFVRDDRVEGINQLRIGFRKGTYNRYLSASSLIIVLIDAGEYAEAVDVADAVLAKYPSNRHYLHWRAVACEQWGRLEEALTAYGRLLENLKADTNLHAFRRLQCNLKLADIHLRLGQMDRALEYARVTRDYAPNSFPEHLRETAAQRLAEGRKIEQHIRSLGAGSR